MALQRSFYEGRKVILTNLLRNSIPFRHLFCVALPKRTRRWNNENIDILRNFWPQNTSSSTTQWQCFKTLRCNYSKIHKDTEFSKSSVLDDNEGDDSVSDGENDSYDDNNDRIDCSIIDSQLEDIFAKKEGMSSAEWDKTIQLMSIQQPSLTAMSYDAVTMKRCQRYGNYTLATSYLEHLHQQGREPNLSTLGNYLQLCGEQVAQCGEERVLEFYHKLMSQVKVLDVRLVMNVILGLAATQEWRQALDHLPHLMKLTHTYHEVFSAIITAAFRTGDYKLGWQYFVALREKEQIPLDSVFLEWMRQCDAVENTAEKEAKALTLLQNLENHDLYLSVAVVKALTQLFRESLGWSAHYVRMPKSGVCPACRHQLDSRGVSEEEFKYLQEEFVQRVLVGSDIFRSTSPAEWSDFKRFVEEKKPFSVVVDGLNASYIFSKKSGALRQKSLQEVVKQASVENPTGRILLLGRQHMTAWHNWRKWNKQRVEVYALHNMSKDDGFFLYAALQSGLGTKFVTNDMLRDHLFRLGEGRLRDAFRRWQRTHQVMAYSSAGCIRLMSPAKFTTAAQASQVGVADTWHVPYDDGAPRQSYEVPATWLCLHHSLALASPLPQSVSREPFAYNGSRKHFDPPPYVPSSLRVLSKDSQAGDWDRVGYAASQRKTTKGQEADDVAAFPRFLKPVANDFSPRGPPPPPRLSHKRLRKGLKFKKGSITADMNLNMIFTEGKTKK